MKIILSRYDILKALNLHTSGFEIEITVDSSVLPAQNIPVIQQSIRVGEIPRMVFVHLRNGYKIAAIKELRTHWVGAGLKDAKDVVESLAPELWK